MKIFSSFKVRFCFILPMVLLSFCTGNKNPGRIGAKISDPGTVSYAKRFKIEKVRGYSQLTVINPWQGAGNVIQKWCLLKEGTKIPAGFDTSEVIRVPVKKIVCMSTTHLAMISALHETGAVKGFSGTGFLYGQEFRVKVADGDIREIGYEDNLNKELILEIAPDLIMVYGVGGESAGYTAKLKELGSRVFFNADYLETDPLGKAEWIKVFGALFCRGEMADSIFRDTERKYNKIKGLVAEKVALRPEVLLGLPFRDTWYISPGNSYVSKLISDAGGKYLWNDTQSSFSMPMGLEAVYIKGLRADFWLNTGTASSLNDIKAIDSRLADLPSFKNGNIYNNNNRTNAEGGNDYWEEGCIRPDLVLEDIVTILHPEMFPGKELWFYKKLK
jgi:iron complex transport system substrate-binding protein